MYLFFLPSLSSQELALVGGDVLSRTVVMTRLMGIRVCVRVCMSTDLTPERRIYIPAPFPVRSSSRDISQYTFASYLDSHLRPVL